MDYTDLVKILNYINDKKSNMWTFENISGHRKLPDNDWEVKVLLGTRSETWEPINITNEYDKLILVANTMYNDILNPHKLKWARSLTQNPKKFIGMSKIFAAQT